MSIKQKAKTYSFWVSLTSAIILVIQLFGNQFGFSVDEGTISDLFTAICGILVILGIIVVPAGTKITLTKTPQVIAENSKGQNSKIEIPAPSTTQNIQTKDDTEISIDTEAENVELIEEKSNDVSEISDNAIINEPATITDKDTHICEDNNIIIPNNELEKISDETFINLKNILTQEKEKFSTNISLYLDLLKNEIEDTEKHIK